MRTSLQPKEKEDLQTARDRWLKENRGVLQRISDELGVSHSKVRFTFIGATRTNDPRVTEALARAGAPGFSE